MRVLIVDDSVVFRTQITHALETVPGVEVVGTAANGKIALEKLAQLSVDLVTLDMEMPGLNGIETLKEIRKQNFKVHVIIFSSQTQRGAEAALDALREGADEVCAKPAGDNLNFEKAEEAVKQALLPKVIQFKAVDENKNTKSNKATNNASATPLSSAPGSIGQFKINVRKTLATFQPAAIVIGCSTGGPAALETIFSNLSGPTRIPIFITQHMPPVFTTSLAKRLGQVSGIPSAEGISNEIVDANRIYVAPGDFHMDLIQEGASVKIKLHQAPQRNSVRPAVDYLFETAAKIYGNKLLSVVLTGMGEDGLVGVKDVRKKGGACLIQNQESCVVFGMPGAIFAADEYDEVGDLNLITSYLKRMISL